MNSRPSPSDYPEFYHSYISLVPDGNIFSFLKNQSDDFQKIIHSIPEEKGSYAYAPDKWSIKQLIGHVTDAERIFAYRALRFARKDETNLPAFEEDDYAKNSFSDERTLKDMAEEFSHLRSSNILMFSTFNPAMLSNKGIANNKQITVNAILHITAGHLAHHMNILKERYL